VVAGLVCTFALALAFACGKAMPHPPYSPQGTGDLIAVSSEPPPARVEVVPPEPSVGAVWLDGEWQYARKRWVWSPGRWVEPIPGATYSPWQTARATDGSLYMAKGVWRSVDGGVIDPPKALAYASPEPGVVFDPTGEVARTGSVAVSALDASADAPMDAPVDAAMDARGD
jgi:hypothetical protein